MPVNAYSHIDRLRPILVAHKDAVFSGIFHGDLVDGDGAAPGLLSDGELVLVSDLPVVPHPEDLWGWFTLDEARQAQRLRRGSFVKILIRPRLLYNISVHKGIFKGDLEWLKIQPFFVVNIESLKIVFTKMYSVKLLFFRFGNITDYLSAQTWHPLMGTWQPHC